MVSSSRGEEVSIIAQGSKVLLLLTLVFEMLMFLKWRIKSTVRSSIV
jgi:hypothetical protein